VTGSLHDLVAAELAEPVDARVTAMAAALAARYPGAARAALFYGSCLREAQLDGLMLDFYLIVSDYRAAFGRGWFAFANRILPPNVFPFEHDGLAAKYAVLSEADFARLNGPGAGDVSVWARFAQPSRLVWAADEAAREQAINAVARAVPTLFALTIPMLDGTARRDALAIFKAGFALTYGAELRAERASRPNAITDTDPIRYQRFGALALAEYPTPRPPRRPKGYYKSGWQEGRERIRYRKAILRRWRVLRYKGKTLSLLRLAKATTTYAGGVDYLAWKINRHAGTKIEVKPWQRRWPILGGLILLPRLLRRGAIR